MGGNVIFVCTGNSCRSQMAEGLLRFLAEGRFEVFSAGIHRHGLNPLAVQVMEEIDIDISGQKSESLDRYVDDPFDFEVTSEPLRGHIRIRTLAFPRSQRPM